VREIVPGIVSWSTFSEQKGFAFNGYAVRTDAGTVVVDPPDPGADGWKELDALAPYEAVFVTNRNHSRAAAAFRERYGAPVRMHEADAERAEVEVDETVTGGESIGGELTVVHVPGKSPGEIAFHAPDCRALIVGDVVIGVPDDELSTYPDEVVRDRAALNRSAARLAELDFEALLLCDGKSIPSGGRQKLREFVAAAGSG
jgi:glyoxylase-like metal-dependent hydrolase (beta-lactamase superfamily II)